MAFKGTAVWSQDSKISALLVYETNIPHNTSPNITGGKSVLDPTF